MELPDISKTSENPRAFNAFLSRLPSTIKVEPLASSNNLSGL